MWNLVEEVEGGIRSSLPDLGSQISLQEMTELLRTGGAAAGDFRTELREAFMRILQLTRGIVVQCCRHHFTIIFLAIGENYDFFRHIKRSIAKPGGPLRQKKCLIPE